MPKFIVHLLLTLLSLPSICAQSQDSIIRLRNPSFEDYPQDSKTPRLWTNCGSLRESPPDVQPCCWSVSLAPNHGRTYLGLVVRETGTYECVSQKLSASLEAFQCYSFSLYLCRSQRYISKIAGKDDQINFETPVLLKIWGGNESCEKFELLANTAPVEEYLWQEYQFYLEPTSEIDCLILEAYPAKGDPVNGHLLLDNCSNIMKVNCRKD